MNETIGALNAILAQNPTYFVPLPTVSREEARVLAVDPQGYRVLWAGAIADILGADLEYEVLVQLKCLHMQSEQRTDCYRDWSPVVFITTQGSEQSLHRILLKPGKHNMIAAIGGCDCSGHRGARVRGVSIQSVQTP